MSTVTPSVKAELRVKSGGKNKSDVATYRIIGAINTTKPRLGTELSENEVDKFVAKHPTVRFNIVSA